MTNPYPGENPTPELVGDEIQGSMIAAAIDRAEADRLVRAVRAEQRKLLAARAAQNKARITHRSKAG